MTSIEGPYPGDLLVDNEYDDICFVIAAREDQSFYDRIFVIDIDIQNDQAWIGWYSQDFIETYYEHCTR